MTKLFFVQAISKKRGLSDGKERSFIEVCDFRL